MNVSRQLVMQGRAGWWAGVAAEGGENDGVVNIGTGQDRQRSGQSGDRR
jgi:hypothetical protein